MLLKILIGQRVGQSSLLTQCFILNKYIEDVAAEATSFLITPMKKILIILIATLCITSACDSKNDVGYYFSDSERDTLLTNIITYMGEKALYANDSTKYQAQFRSEYVKRLPLYHFVHLIKDTTGTYYFLISRPVAV